MRLTAFRLSAAVLLAAPLVAGLPAAAQEQAAAGAPNIVLIYTDDQALEDMVAMPRTLALLGEQGTTFTNGYSPYPLCCPARASILTGQYSHNHGVLGNGSEDHPLGGWEAFDESSTVATWLSAAGYQTAYVGKYLNHYGEGDISQNPPGWDEWHVSVAGGNYFSTRLVENGDLNVYSDIYQTDLYANLSVDMIEQIAPDAQPFFLVSAFYGPHSGRPEEPDDPTVTLGVNMLTPAVAPRHRDAFAGTPLPMDPSFNEADVSDKPLEWASKKRLSTRLQEAMTESHQQRLEALLAVDEGIERIVAAVDAAGELDNTVFVFTTDNGWMQGQHRIHAGKAVPYEPALSVPFIIRGPGFPAGETRTQPVSLVDLAPTFADLAGATPDLVVDGLSLLPLAAAPQQWRDRPLVFMTGPRSLTGPNHWMGVRARQWLYVEYDETDEVELYNMVNDPYQLRNQAGQPNLAAVQARLRDMLDRLRECSGASCRRFN